MFITYLTFSVALNKMIILFYQQLILTMDTECEFLIAEFKGTRAHNFGLKLYIKNIM